MILGAEEEIIPKYYDDDKPQKRSKDGFWAGLDYIALVIGELYHFLFAFASRNKKKPLQVREKCDILTYNHIKKERL